MSEQLKLSAETRERAGKGASRAMRREGRVPAVIYGNNQEHLSIHVEEKELVKLLNTGFFMNSVVMVEVGGKAQRTLPKDVQFHPVTDRPLHVDFLRIGAHSRVVVGVPVRFVNEEESRGLKRGGVLNVVRHELELSCEAANIPDEILIDLSGYDIGDSIHISAVALPEGATPTIEDRDFTIATLVGSSGMKAEAAEAEAAEAGEAPAGGEEAAAGGDAADKTEA
jgi:large subunit ribosomal protein L25